MIHILSYNDLEKLGDNDADRAQFIVTAIAQHKASDQYKAAKDAQAYYDGENPTIMRYEKIIYDFMGRAMKDEFSANHKIASNFFGFVVDQEVSYLLRNGIMFNKDDTEKKLGKDIHRRVADVLEAAAIAGVGFGFWNNDHLEPFYLADSQWHPGFVPLYDEDDGSLRAGIRYWQVDNGKPMHATLYETDGQTEFVKARDEEMKIEREKQPYKIVERVSAETGEVLEELSGENYKGFPIVPMRYKKNGQSELQGKRNTLDALDLVSSNMVNNVDEANLIYWIIENAAGMDDLDDLKFLQKLKTMHVAHAGEADGTKATPHTIEAPHVATQEAIGMLTRRLYEDFQAFDASAVTAGNHTATAIKASYVPLDLKVDKVEDNVTDFLERVMELAGIDDTPTFTRNRIINTAEETTEILAGAEYYDAEYVLKKLLTVRGDADQFDDIIKRKMEEEAARFAAQQPITPGGEPV